MRIASALALTTTLAACAGTKQEVKPTVDTHALARRAAMAELYRNFRRVHFEFDSALLSGETRDALATNVSIMRRFPEIAVEIQGHCDERGTSEYNLALGDRRAHAIHKYMVLAGVGETRVSTISFGEELPLMDGDDGFALAENRRAEFRLRVTPSALIRGTVASRAYDMDPAFSPLAAR